LALIDKPTDAFDKKTEKSVPVISASELKAHSEAPAVRARLARVTAIVDARNAAAGADASSPA